MYHFDVGIAALAFAMRTASCCSVFLPIGARNIAAIQSIKLYLAVENIDHSRTKAKSPQTNGIVERFHKTMLNEFYRIAFRKKIYATISELQKDLDVWMTEYNRASEHPSVYVIERKRSCWLGCDPEGYFGFCRARSVMDRAANMPSYDAVIEDKSHARP